ncbi:hypothetical protein Rxycam_01503 [Rubrobacter xylanophilus DSM 9941]|uniref:hypothetical protein n=1 Tax=Rubrobacter xylanophilus TaxID=49319 RepID=UPI001C6416EE|nr:hypothetical protein [Rubrobacter xylanophilus]QYJ15677.1 hypothetical protein Rxycam_01503 [Rubrobacter xylanophilus DSM 9941]
MRVWMAAMGGEAFYEQDLTGCCRRSASSARDAFECPACGAMWQTTPAAEPEGCAFTRGGTEESKGAA